MYANIHFEVTMDTDYIRFLQICGIFKIINMNNDLHIINLPVFIVEVSLSSLTFQNSTFSVLRIYLINEVHHKDNISRIFWYSDWLHNTTSAGNSIFVTNHNTTSCGRSIMQPIRLP